MNQSSVGSYSFQNGLNLVKSTFTSTPVVVLLMSSGVSLFLMIISLFNIIINIGAYYTDFGMFVNGSNNISEMINSSRIMVLLIGIIVLAVTALPIIGVLLSFLKSRNPFPYSTPKVGLTLLFVSAIINIIIYGILTLVLLIMFFTMMSYLAGIAGTTGAEGIVGVALILSFANVFAICVCNLIFQIGLCYSASSAKKTIQNNMFYTKGFKFLYVAAMIMSILYILSAVRTTFSMGTNFLLWVETVLNAVTYISVVMIVKKHTNNIYAQNETISLEPTSPVKNSAFETYNGMSDNNFYDPNIPAYTPNNMGSYQPEEEYDETATGTCPMCQASLHGENVCPKCNYVIF